LADLARLLNLFPEECAELFVPELASQGLRLIRSNLMMA
jgi:hypothetical protein